MILGTIKIDKKGKVTSTNVPNLSIKDIAILDEIEKSICYILRYDSTLWADYQFRICLHNPSSIYQKYDFDQMIFTNYSLKDVFLPLIHFYNEDYIQKISELRYNNIMDSSIWNYKVAYKVDWYRNINRKKLKIALKSIKENTCRKLYELCVAWEYANLEARKTRQAYLENYSSKRKGHAEYVSPFIFHSESETKETIEKEFKIDRDTIEEIKKEKWRILLVDDKADELMTKKRDSWNDNEKNVLDIWNNKIKVIKGLIATYFGLFQVESKAYESKDNLSENCHILIEYVSDINQAKEALKAKKYDIILLDYLLETNDKKAEYGYELLNELSKELSTQNGKTKYNIDIHEKLYFMFISAYTSAIYERLQAENLNQDEDYWYISLGACPVNTPQLFLYNLIKLMERRLEQSRIKYLNLPKIVKDLSNIFSPNGDNVRLKANESYLKILRLQYDYRQILGNAAIPEDNIFKTPKYVLQTNFIKNNPRLGGLLEHLAELVHLIGFGTVRQWPEMWEEYIYVKAQLETQVSKLGNETKDEVKNLCKNIEDYILKIKSSAL